jgi:hypothetical protein
MCARRVVILALGLVGAAVWIVEAVELLPLMPWMCTWDGGDVACWISLHFGQWL